MRALSHIGGLTFGRYSEQAIGLADASIVVLSHRHQTIDVLTLDERHFRVLRAENDLPFRILPADGGA